MVQNMASSIPALDASAPTKIDDIRLQDAANSIGSGAALTLMDGPFQDVSDLLSDEQLNELSDRVDEAALECLREQLWRITREVGSEAVQPDTNDVALSRPKPQATPQ